MKRSKTKQSRQGRVVKRTPITASQARALIKSGESMPLQTRAEAREVENIIRRVREQRKRNKHAATSGVDALPSASVVRRSKTKRATKGRIIKRGKLKVWTGTIPDISLEEAIERVRHGSDKSAATRNADEFQEMAVGSAAFLAVRAAARKGAKP